MILDRISVIVFMGLFGVIGLAIGGSILFIPDQFQANANIVYPSNPSLYSEVRAPGAFLALLSGGILAAVFVRAWRLYALFVIGAINIAYGLGRVVSIVLDGMPSSTILIAMSVEFLAAMIAIYLVMIYQREQTA
jgi:hypothetical protein